MLCSPFLRLLRYNTVVSRWCTVTVVDGQGRRHSIDVQAESTFDAAHLYVVHAKADAPYAPPPGSNPGDSL
jgi:hypothetical protein